MDRTEQTAPTTPPRAQRWAEGLLAVVALVLAWRAASLAFGPRDGAAVVPDGSHRIAVAAPATPPEPKTLTQREYAAIVGLCPTAAAELPPELLPPTLRPAPEPTAASGRLTGLRIASRGEVIPLAVERIAQETVSENDGWLVAPDAWFSPEDQKKRQPSAADATPATPELGPPKPGKTLDTTPPTADWKPQPSGPATEEPQQEPLAEVASDAGPPEPEPAPSSAGEPPAPDGASYPDTTDPSAGMPAGAMTKAPVFAPPGVATPDPAEEADPESGGEAVEEPADEPPADGPATTEPAEDAAPQAEVGPRWEGPFDAVAPEPTAPVLEDPADEETETEQPAQEAAPLNEPTAEPLEGPQAEAAPAAVEPAPASAPATFDPPRSEAQAPAPGLAPAPLPRTLTPPAAPSASALFGAPGATEPLAPHAGGAQAAAAARTAAAGKSADESHRELFAKNCYPSALQCAECHKRIYDEWSVSSHAYAYVSPMFHKFEQTITKLSNGTVGHFCTRCHSPVAVAMYEPRSVSIDELPDAAREGITCIACHRVNQRWGRSNGERRLETGDIYAPVYGAFGGDGVAEAIAKKSEYKVKTSPEEKGPGVAMHAEGRFFDQLALAEACTSCHQVSVQPGVKLEVVWEQYRASPACKKGITCQECHMGRVPGLPGGYNLGPIAEVNGKTVNNQRKQSNHVFYGPGYSIAHPGLFPQHKDAKRWKLAEWTAFDWRAGWGTDEFEEKVEEAEDAGVATARWFPAAWADADDRYDAREVIDDNLEKLKTKRRYRELVMENGSKVEGPFFRSAPTPGSDLEFDYVVTNLNEGHNLPTASLGAQPQLWANVVLVGPDGRRIWESGYTDSNGDLCDIHSAEVRHGRAPFDRQLFNLQTMFLITGATGTDREFYLPVNLDIDQVAQLRPGTVPYSVLNHPPFIRMENRSLTALGKKRVKYTVPAELMRQPGRYRLSFRLRNRTEPMYFMRLCEVTPEMLRSMVEGTLDIHPQSVEFEVY